MSEIQKKRVALEAIKYVKDDCVIGVGTGSTVNFFIEELAKIKGKIEAVVASSKATEALLRDNGLPVIDLNVAGQVKVYIDGADEVTKHKTMIKGGGGALTREKIVAACASQFVCIVDESKLVKRLGLFPVAVEVLPMARSYVAREIVKLGGSPEYREGFITDNGNIILDVYELPLETPMAMEAQLNNIVGVVCHGIFAKREADIVLVASDDTVQTLT